MICEKRKAFLGKDWNFSQTLERCFVFIYNFCNSIREEGSKWIGVRQNGSMSMVGYLL